MKTGLSLTAKILLVAMVNVAALAAIAAAFVRYELGRELGSFLLTPARDRSVSVARQLALDLADTAPADRDALLDRYSREQEVTFLLVLNDGTRVAGPALSVPPAVLDRVTRVPPRGDDRRPPPQRGGPPPPFEPDEGRAVGPARLPGVPPFLATVAGPLKYWVGVRIPIHARGEARPVPGTLLLASSSLLSNPFFFQPLPWLTVALVTLGVTVICWLPLVGGLTTSISSMTRVTAQIADGHFIVDDLPSRGDELGTLSAAIRTMAVRLKTLLDGQRRFLADAAHELRSPLARISLSLGLIERAAGERARRHVDDLREDVEQMTTLTDDLLAFARSQASPMAPRLVPTLVADAAKRAVKLEARDADVRVDIAPTVRVTADPDLLVRALSNVIRNAVIYAGSAGPIEVTADAEGNAVRVRVADQGDGIPEGDLENVFSAFYRPDISRDRRSGGGTGLGLAIARSAVEACRGSIDCRNRSPRGLEVSIRLPAA